MKREIDRSYVNAIGFGCMALSHGYTTNITEKEKSYLLNQALDLGYNFLDTATMYGYGENEKLIAKAIGNRRHEYILASKCGLHKTESGIIEINNNPKILKQHCENSLRRLNTDVIDLYYLHRWDKNIPIEESVEVLAQLVKEGKIKAIGLSEIGANTLHRAHKVHPIAALQTEYSLWTRNPEIAVLNACRELGVAFVAFSPVGRGYLTGKVTEQTISNFNSDDFRLTIPRFNETNYKANLNLLSKLEPIASAYECNIAQLSLAWLLAKGDDIIPIPSTTKLNHLEENFQAMNIIISNETVIELDKIFTPDAIYGERYSKPTQSQVDTETFEFEK